MAAAESGTWTEPFPVGKTKGAQERNAELLSGYDYAKYNTSITGYTGQDLQRITVSRYQAAVRTRVGPRGNYKAGFTRLADGKLLIAVCRNEPNPDFESGRAFQMYVYESNDDGLTWQEIAKPGLLAKEPSLSTLPDGSVLMTAQNADFQQRAVQKFRTMYIARSDDAGRTWESCLLERAKYPRQVVVEDDGTVLFMMADQDLNLTLARSTDAGRSWDFATGTVAWADADKGHFDEVTALRLRDGTLLAALRREIPGCEGEGFEDTMITRSEDDGRTWSAPERMVNTAEVHVCLTQLADGRLLATHSTYHLPYGARAILSTDQGRTWDLEHPVDLSISADLYVGWPVTLQLPDGDLITSYAGTTYLEQKPDTTTCEVVRWQLPW